MRSLPKFSARRPLAIVSVCACLALVLCPAPLHAQDGTEPSGLRDWYAESRPIAAVRYVPTAVLDFNGTDLTGDAKAYRKVLEQNPRYGEMVSLGYLGGALDLYYTRVEADFEVNRLADVADTPDTTSDDVRVNRAAWREHSLFVAHMAGIGDSRFFVHFAYGYTFATLTVDETTPEGASRTTTREFSHFRLHVEPMVELYTDTATGFSIAAGYPVIGPVFFAKSLGAGLRGPGLWIAAQLPWGDG